MIRTVFIKEIHDHLLSMRFQAGFLLALVLVTCSAAVLGVSLRREGNEQYWRARAENEFLGKYAHLNRLGFMRFERPPAPVALVRGLPDDAGIETLDGNPLRELFAPADFTAIAAVVFSLFAIVLGFDAVNGERERGTLRLMFTNHLRRFEVLAAKWAAGMSVLAVALAAALAAGAAIVFATSGVRWSAADWISFAAIFLAAVLHTGAFFSLALAMSAVARRSSVSVIASVFAWVVLALIVPNVSPYAAAQFVRLPSRAAHERDLGYLTNEQRDEVGRALEAKARAAFPAMNVSREERKRRLAEDPAFKREFERMRDAVEAAWDEANRIQRGKAERLSEAYKAVAKRQFELSRRLSCASPVPPLVYANTELAATGFTARAAHSDQARAFGSGPWRQYLMKRYRDEQRKNPAFGVNDFLDIGDRPRFAYQPPAFSDRVDDALPYVGMLAGWNLALFSLALLAFLRFDVR